MPSVKDVVVTVFACIFFYAVLPAFSLWCLVVSWALCAYTIKMMLYLTTGSASMVGATGPAAIAPTLAESVAGGVLGVFCSGIYVLYRYFRLRYRYGAGQMMSLQPMIPLKETQ